MSDTLLSHDDIARLCDVFEPRQHMFREEKYADKSVFHVYLTEEAITERLDEVDPAWGFEIIDEHRAGDYAVCRVNMCVKGVLRSGVGMERILTSKSGDKEVNEAEKAAATDALKRAARMFGIGRYILKMGHGINNHAQLVDWLARYSNSGDFSRVGRTTTTPAGTPPQNGKSGGKKQESVRWVDDPEQWGKFKAASIKYYAMNPDYELCEIFDSSHEAWGVMRGEAENGNWPMVATSAKYTKLKDSNAGTIEFNTDLPCKTFQGRTWLAKQMELDENAFKTWVSGREYDLPFPVIIEWAREGNTRGNAGYRKVKSVKVLPLESEQG